MCSVRCKILIPNTYFSTTHTEVNSLTASRHYWFNFIKALLHLAISRTHNAPENVFTGFPRISAVCRPHLDARKDAAAESFLCCSFRRSRLRAVSLFCDCERWLLHLTEIPVGRWVARTAVSTLFTFCPPCPPERIVSYTMSLSDTSGSETGAMNSTPTNQFLRGWPGR